MLGENYQQQQQKKKHSGQHPVPGLESGVQTLALRSSVLISTQQGRPRVRIAKFSVSFQSSKNI